MYQRHFAFTRLPFETPAETDELFESSARREAEARLGHLIELRGIGMLTGEVGSGKTTVCRYLTAQLHPGLYRVHYVSLTTGNVLDMYKSIAWEIGIAVERSRSSAHHAIRTEISRLAKEAKQLPVLVVDEAHHLRNDVLEDLRLLTNFAMDSEQRMCLILVGLTELRRRLSMAVHESLSQRLVGLCCKLGEGAMRDQGASCSPYDSALARRSCSHAMASVRAHGPRPKARSTIRASPTMPPWRANIPAWPLRSARITSKPLIVA